MAETAPSRSPNRSSGQQPAPGATRPSGDPNLWIYFAAGGVAGGAAGYFIHKRGTEKEEAAKDLKKQIPRAKDKTAREDAQMQYERLNTEAGRQQSVGMGLELVGIGFLLAGVLVALRVRPRFAMGMVAPFLAVAALYGVYNAGIESMVVSSLLGVALVYYMTGEPDPRKKRAFDAFRKFPVRREAVPELAPEQRWADVMHVVTQVEQQKLLKRLEQLPVAHARILPAIGEGTALGYLQLKRDIASVAFVDDDDFNATQYVSVLMTLERSAPSFVARPLPIVDGAPVPNVGLRFQDDAAFSAKYWVSVPPGQDPRAVRAFLSGVVRDELLSLPNVWLHVQGTVMALTVYGPFDAELVDHLVDVGDVLFAEYGADNGPSLLDPDDAEIVGGETLVKKPKKKRKKPAPEGPSASSAP
ncbi:MAG: hypothetical protein HOW73_20920 [Polyangiaceae bacterium]|nr:hypothetical protein [Polyangiaceae bacterium]